MASIGTAVCRFIRGLMRDRADANLAGGGENCETYARVLSFHSAGTPSGWRLRKELLRPISPALTPINGTRGVLHLGPPIA